MRKLGLLFALVFPVVVLAQTGQISVRVTDFDTGAVVTNAEVHAGFNTSIAPGWGWGGGRPNREKGLTGTNGICTLTGSGNGGSVGVAAFKDGYYGSAGYNVKFTNITGTVQKRWQPWDPTVEVVLKRIGNPIPMFAKWVRDTTIPAEGQPVGFDLMKGDWVVPQGKGETADLLFRLDKNPQRVVTNRYGTIKLFDDRLTVSFLNDGDGLQSVFIPARGGRSNLRLSAIAPEAGYITNIVRRICKEENRPPHSDVREDQNYFFRVRTVKDAKGNIVSALYGKIYGDFQFDNHGKLTFTYYLNPTPNDRNLEFDPKRNLFKSLRSTEEVTSP